MDGSERLDPEAERRRLDELRVAHVPWHRWGPYLSERQWGTVREDYSAHGTAWDHFPHDHARSRAYRWGEDGLLGISDDHGWLCFAVALWNEADPILKERLFGLAGPEGNHGEDVKEYYVFLDNVPSHAYMKALYRYPQRVYPYAALVEENRRRGRGDPEFELVDTGVFAENRFFDIGVEYAKADPHDLVIRITVTNHGPQEAPLRLLPTLWFRNTWAWGRDDRRPHLRAVAPGPGGRGGEPFRLVRALHFALGEYWLACQGAPELLFTDNETNARRLWGVPNRTRYVKDAFHEAVVSGRRETVNPDASGTKVAAHYGLRVPAGASHAVLLRLSAARHAAPFAGAGELLARRRAEADAFYRRFEDPLASDDARLVMRQAFAGLLWSKQTYHYDVEQWLQGDPAGPSPPTERLRGRNAAWRHVNNGDVLSVPDTWEYPWYAAWDLAFHCIPLALVDPEFAKRQLLLLLREWYMHPNGQLPAYEWAFDDVNPPVHAWAAWRVYKIERRVTGRADLPFLERVFQKLLINFTWWVNREDVEGRNVFQGGFLGLDNIGVFDRSKPLPTGGYLEQADGTAWMGMYCLNMLAIALELAGANSVYEDVATKFFEHFMYIAGALNDMGGGMGLWDDEEEFFYDVLRLPDGQRVRLRVRSLVGLIPLLAVETIEPALLDRLPGFRERMDWFLANRPDLAALVSRWNEPGEGERRLLALVRGHRMKRVLRCMLDPEELLSDFGVRSLSRYHRDHPFVLAVDATEHAVAYEPAETATALFGGNSNWRGPVWFPINFLLIEALQKFHHYYGDDFLVEHPTGSGQKRTLWQIAMDLERRLVRLFLRGPDGRRPVFGANTLLQTDPLWRDHILFYEYFHGETGAGLGASHQTGWTALVAKLLEQSGGR
ncbi:MAG: glucosidase [Armatimonadota bacterium]|nr:glucosidase [Armatimonadota bacterium]MDR7423234.1 glucosidase [Armatimonadota bacterium]MDR7453122.1 glucosidase [Armatimonadota bacterium]MDR7456137.1 glucosidase [Armatimonadota bacterium]MDR7497890.1 glucosidase [Armatimonadota bacterium]